MRDSTSSNTPISVWGSLGQPAFPTTSSEMVSSEFIYWLDLLANGSTLAGRMGGIATKLAYETYRTGKNKINVFDL